VFRGRAVVAALLAAFALAGATGASAAIVTSHDDQGRPITFDVRATKVDTEWYASVLRAAAHGNEISDVKIVIVPEPQIPAFCGGQDAAACYTGKSGQPTIYVPAGKSRLLESTLLHEYGHHLDTYWNVSGVPELNGTPTWWAARGMAELLANHQVAFDYSLGWEHSIGEIFAEDYAYIHTHSRYAIVSWLKPPDAALASAMFAELGTPTEALPFAPEVPLVINRRGTLVPRDSFSVPFGLLGPGRRVTVAATISKPNRKGVRARAQLVCDGKTVATRTFRKGQARRTLDIPNLGPAKCDVRLVSIVSTSLTYTLRISLALESA
jgi:predicted thioesterase